MLKKGGNPKKVSTSFFYHILVFAKSKTYNEK